MKPVVLSLLVASMALGEEPIAKLDDTKVLFIQSIKKGELSPVDGRVLDVPSYVAIAQRVKQAESERDLLRANPSNPNWGWVIGTCAVVLVGGFAAGWAVHSAVK